MAKDRGDTRTLLKRAGLVASGTLASRVLGAVRDAVIAATFTLGATDVFWMAFTIPNALRVILGEGAVGAGGARITAARVTTTMAPTLGMKRRPSSHASSTGSPPAATRTNAAVRTTYCSQCAPPERRAEAHSTSGARAVNTTRRPRWTPRWSSTPGACSAAM